jgi:hypothetical protein
VVSDEVCTTSLERVGNLTIVMILCIVVFGDMWCIVVGDNGVGFCTVSHVGQVLHVGRIVMIGQRIQ